MKKHVNIGFGSVEDSTTGGYKIDLHDYRTGRDDVGNLHNQQIYRISTDSIPDGIVKDTSARYFVKIPSERLHANSSFAYRSPKERVKWAERSYREIPEIYTETVRIEVDGKPAVLQRDVTNSIGKTYLESLQDSDYRSIDEGIRTLRKIHEKKRVIGDFKAEDHSVSGPFFDNETYGIDDPLKTGSGDLVKLYHDANKYDHGDYVLGRVRKHYGTRTADRLAEAA